MAILKSQGEWLCYGMIGIVLAVRWGNCFLEEVGDVLKLWYDNTHDKEYPSEML